jgi:hypothetical protein
MDFSEEKEALSGPFEKPAFVEALKAQVATLRAKYEGRDHAPVKGGFFDEAMSAFVNKGRVLALDEVDKTIDEIHNSVTRS